MIYLTIALYFAGMVNQFFTIRAAELYAPDRKVKAQLYQIIIILIFWPLMSIVSVYWYLEEK